MSIELITILIFGSVVVGLALGLPLAFALGGVAVVFTFFLWGPEALYMVASRTFGVMSAFILVAIPLFIFMANVLERSGSAEDLYSMMYHWMGPLRGGLAMGTVVICTLFAAMAGISGAATVTMGLIALPSMLKRHYNKNIAVGCIAAGGALGILIPPSVIMIIYALMAGVSVGKMFLGGIFPGLILATLFIVYIGIRCAFQRDLGPVVPPEERVGWREKLISIRAVIIPVLLVIGVLGSIFTGIASPSEAAAIGATGSLLSAAIYRRLNWKMLKEAWYRTLKLNVMIMWIVVGASLFTAAYTAIGAPELIKAILMEMPGGPWGILIGIQATFFILGMFLDPTGIVLITTPIFVPIIKTLGFDPIWFGILFVINMEMAYLTPPFGFNLFYMKGVVPKGITMGDIYRSIVPFVGLQLVGLIICMIFPQIALVLPNLVFGR
jgi:tripartite ATP-independent transporter DctM subunit